MTGLDNDNIGTKKPILKAFVLLMVIANASIPPYHLYLGMTLVQQVIIIEPYTIYMYLENGNN